MWVAGPQTRHFLADTYLAFVFWTVLTSLGLCVWYFPLWHMGISGYEVALLSDMAPVLLAVPFVRRALRRHRAIAAAVGLAGVAAYAVADPAQRLLAVALGTAGVMLGLGAVLYEDRVPAAGRLERDIMAWEAGLVASVAVRMLFQTNNPAWPTINPASGGWNRTALVLGALAVLDVLTRGADAEAAERSAKKHDLAAAPAHARKHTTAWLPTALGFGALLFALHSMYTDSAIVGRWAWDGYPSTGPAPVPWGGLVITALAAGFSVGHRVELATGALWWAVAAIGAALITCVSGWAGFAGALVLGLYLGSVTRAILGAVARCPPGRTMLVATAWYNVLVLAH
ncbi:Protein cwh43, partial [Coemansia nantahalensis]